jgi:alkaline phosphatase
MKLRKNLATIVFACLMAFMASTAYAAPPKYVFFFLGDGMSSSQIQATEAYLTQTNDGSAKEAADLLLPQNRLKMSKMPVAGMQTTFDAHALMTDSASSATAFACGIKTLSGVIGMDDAKDTRYKSVAQLAETGYEFFGGGGLASPTKAKKDGDTNNDVWTALAANGYEVRNTKADIEALRTTPRDKVVAINPVLPGSAAMPYAIDKPADNLSLAEMTDLGIKVLSANGGLIKGFFLMVEGGKIDWACHANDAVATIGDMIDFDNAVGMALEFYKAYPRDTLIIVTGDHETGGMTIGHATTGYTAYYDRLLGQKKSYEHFEANQWAAHKAANASGYDYTRPNNLEGNKDMINLLATEFGITYSTLNAYQKEKLEDAYDKSMTYVDKDNKGYNDNSADENTYLYGGYEPIIVTITHILNEQASIGWTSYSHTGVPVPVFAQGMEAENFYGFYDNTDIAKKLAKIMGITQALPIVK